MTDPECISALFENPLSESDFEDGEIVGGEEEEGAKLGVMDVDTVDGQTVSLEEGEVVEADPTRDAFTDREKQQQIESASDIIATVAVDSGHVEDLKRKARKKNKKKRGSRQSAKRVNVAQFVRETCAYLQETKHSLVWAAVKNLGVESVRDLVKEVDAIEKYGGQMTNDGKRKRTPGGVLWNILRGRVQPFVYKEIMSQGNKVHKEKIQEAKESLKRNRMDIDEPVSNKRQKFNIEDGSSAFPEVQKEHQKKPHKSGTSAQKPLDVTYGSLRDNSSISDVQLQRAWAEGIRKKETLNETAMEPSPESNLVITSKETVPTVPPEKKSAPLIERIRVPVQYNDLVKQKNSVLLFAKSLDPVLPVDPEKGVCPSDEALKEL